VKTDIRMIEGRAEILKVNSGNVLQGTFLSYNI